MKRIVPCILAAVLIVIATPAGAQGPDLSDMSGKLPRLVRTASAVTIPLDNGWRPIRDGVDTSPGEGGLRIAYAIAGGQPAGAALLFGEGSLDGVRLLRLRITAERSMQIIPTLQTAGGAAFAFPAISLVKGKAVEVDLPTSELSYFPPQSKVDEPDNFAPADAIMLTLLDISGFTGGSGETVFIVGSIDGVL